MSPTAVFLLGALGFAAAAEYTTPVPILKQIDRHNDDGSYSYGYEGADGSYKIETKYNTGEVYGKYGYVDDTGKLREVEYGANKHGFMPAGNDINVAPPTLDAKGHNAPLDGNVDDGQYREDPSIYHKDPRYNDNQVQPKGNAVSQSSFQSSWGSQPTRSNFDFTFNNNPWDNQQRYAAPVYNPPAPVYNPPAPVYNPPQSSRWNQGIYTPQQNYQNPQPQTYQNPQPQVYQQQNYYTPQRNYYEPQNNYVQQPYYFNPSQFVTHPAVKNIDYLTGSYSVSYGRR